MNKLDVVLCSDNVSVCKINLFVAMQCHVKTFNILRNGCDCLSVGQTVGCCSM